MELPKELAKGFAELVSNNGAVENKEIIAYGQVTRNGEEVFVQLDGTDLLTPVSKAMDAEQNDRVMVVVKNHTATVVGNITSPASARTATNFMKLTDAGLVVGTLGFNGRPTGTYSLIAPGVYRIMDENDTELASFSKDAVSLGRGTAVFGKDSITLANGMATFSEEGVSLGKGIASFSKDSITLANGMATITGSSISLANGSAVFSGDSIILGSEMLKITQNSITLGKGIAVFGTESISLASGMATFSATSISLGKGMATFGTSSISLGSGMATFSTSSISLGKGIATFSTTSISLGNGMATFTTNSISLGKGMATFNTDSITLGSGMAKFTTTSVSLGNGVATFTTDTITLSSGMAKITGTQVSLANGVAIFGKDSISLSNGMAKITATSVSLGNGVATFTTDSISLSNGMAKITATEISLANGAASFSSSKLKLGNSDSSIIELCNAKGTIKMVDGILTIGNNSVAVGFRSIYGSNRAEAVCRSTSTVTAAGLQVFANGSAISSVIVDPNGARFMTPNDQVTNNGYEMVQSNRLMVSSTVIGKGKIGRQKRLTITVNVKNIPAGYVLAGIRQITTNHGFACRMTQFFTHPGTDEDNPWPRVGCTFVCMAEAGEGKAALDLEVKIEWFALRCNMIQTVEDTVITWEDEGSDVDA